MQDMGTILRSSGKVPSVSKVPGLKRLHEYRAEDYIPSNISRRRPEFGLWYPAAANKHGTKRELGLRNGLRPASYLAKPYRVPNCILLVRVSDRVGMYCTLLEPSLTLQSTQSPSPQSPLARTPFPAWHSKTYCRECKHDFGKVYNYNKHRRDKHENIRFACRQVSCRKSFSRRVCRDKT